MNTILRKTILSGTTNKEYERMWCIEHSKNHKGTNQFTDVDKRTVHNAQQNPFCAVQTFYYSVADIFENKLIPLEDKKLFHYLVHIRYLLSIEENSKIVDLLNNPTDYM